MTRLAHLFYITALLAVLVPPSGSAAEGDERLRARLEDVHAEGSTLWVYNDISAGIERARRENKPLFVTFRCVPCDACAGFDADVANGNKKVSDLAREKFVSVRQVEMKGVDLSLFEFDHDLNWAAMFVNADGVVYARYGTQSADGPDAYNSIEGLLNTMRRVLELHADYPNNVNLLKLKRGKKEPGTTALAMPGLKNPAKLAKQTTRQNCIHCHNIHDAQNMHAQSTGEFTHDILWRYPLPDQVGLIIDREQGRMIVEVQANSPAAKAGLKRGEEVVEISGQAIASIADMQWALHQLPNKPVDVEVVGSETGTHALQLAAGWKQYDASWRGSMWSISPRLRVWTPPLSANRRRALGIADSHKPLETKWINTGSRGGKAARASGLREGDIITHLAGRPLAFTPQQFNLHLKLNYKVGDELPLTVLRDGERRELRIKLVE